MGPLDKISPSSPLPPAQPVDSKKKSKGYNLENLPTVIEKIITSFLPPQQAFTASATSTLVKKMMQNNGIWQTVARTLNIKLVDPKHARADLETLFLSVNKLALTCFPSDVAKNLSTIKEPFEQNKAIEKHLQSKPDFQIFENLISKLTAKPDLDRTDIETVKMFLRSGILDSQPKATIDKILMVVSGTNWPISDVNYFSQPQIIKLILERLKEKNIPLEQFNDLLQNCFSFAPITLDKRNKECIVALLEGGLKISNANDIFDQLLLLTDDQWPIFELFSQTVSPKERNELRGRIADMGGPPNVNLNVVRRRIIRQSLFEPILAYTTEQALKDPTVPQDQKSIKAYKEAVARLNSLSNVFVDIIRGNRPAEHYIKTLSDKLPLSNVEIGKIVNDNWNLEHHQKRIAAFFARVGESLSKQ